MLWFDFNYYLFFLFQQVLSQLFWLFFLLHFILYFLNFALLFIIPHFICLEILILILYFMREVISNIILINPFDFVLIYFLLPIFYLLLFIDCLRFSNFNHWYFLIVTIFHVFPSLLNIKPYYNHLVLKLNFFIIDIMSFIPFLHQMLIPICYVQLYHILLYYIYQSSIFLPDC